MDHSNAFYIYTGTGMLNERTNQFSFCTEKANTLMYKIRCECVFFTGGKMAGPIETKCGTWIHHNPCSVFSQVKVKYYIAEVLWQQKLSY